MTKDEALAMYGDDYRKLAEALGITDRAVRAWSDEKIPELRELQLRYTSLRADRK